MIASNNLTQKLIALAKTIAGWATELDKLNDEHRAKVAEYLDKVADTHARASAALSHLETEPTNKKQKRIAEQEFGRIKGYVDTIVDVLYGHLDGRKLAGVKRRINGIDTDIRIGEPGSNTIVRVVQHLNEAEGYFRAIADALRAPTTKRRKKPKT
ncbi:MAG: hypothetical protein AAFR75_04045 [Pseudomonadota bacterium]